jgi:hypothetical protein
MVDDDLFDRDPIVGASAPARPSVSALRPERPLVERAANDRAAREALFREVLERDPPARPAARDPFEEGRFAHERRAMLAAVMGGRR